MENYNFNSWKFFDNENSKIIKSLGLMKSEYITLEKKYNKVKEMYDAVKTENRLLKDKIKRLEKENIRLSLVKE
jgi:hypothetical protein